MAAREKWQRQVERWSKSGLTRREFAARAGVNPHTLSYWKWRLRKESGGAKARRHRKEPTFIEVTGAAAWWQGSDRLEIVVGDDIVVRVPEQFDVESLRRVLEVLRTSDASES